MLYLFLNRIFYLLFNQLNIITIMITKICIRNFKKLENVSFDLGNPVVLIGPNNSGKTTILQALTLWDIGMRKWAEKRKDKKANPKSKRTGVAINRKDLLSLPIPDSKLMWFRQHVRESDISTGTRKTSNVKIEIKVEGIYQQKNWKSSLEFDFSNSESIYCRPLNFSSSASESEIIDDLSYNEKIAYLQPMSGLASEEDKLTPGSIDVRVGMGKTADVLRNIIYQLINPERSGINNGLSEKNWEKLKEQIKSKFLIDINMPEFNPDTGIIDMSYFENGIKYDLSSGGRGFHQTLLLLSYLYSYPGRIILIDEPDAHLEVIRQREIYNLLVEVAKEQDSQLIIASHSEIVLQQAGDADTVVAIFGNETQNLNTNQDISQFKKALTDIGWDKYYYAKLLGHILYFEGSTDFLMIKEFSKLLNHPLAELLDRANVHYLSNNLPNDAITHFYGLKQVIKNLKGVALFDRLDRETDNPNLPILTWKKKEFENYFGFPFVLRRFIEPKEINIFNSRNTEFIEEAIKNNTPPRALNNLNDKWWSDTKLSEDYLENIFIEYYSKLGLKNEFNKGRFYELIKFLKPEEVDDEIKEKLDSIYLIIGKDE
jgi:AAA15 family ATPase/GTPase